MAFVTTLLGSLLGLSRVKIPSFDLYILIGAAVLAIIALIAIAMVVKEVLRVKKVLDAEKLQANIDMPVNPDPQPYANPNPQPYTPNQF